MKKNKHLIFMIFGIILTFLFSYSSIPVEASGYDRIMGSDRIATSIEIAKKGWPNGLDSTEKVVIIARADNPIDALAAASLVGVKNSPVLLTYPNSIDTRVLDEIVRLNTKKVYIIGGVQAVSQNVELKIRQKVSNVVRISGADRYQTASEINKISGLSQNNKAIIANGTTIVDAISASSNASINKIPIYLAAKNNLPLSLPSSIKEVTIYGGTEVISYNIKKQLNLKGIKVNRIFGQDRYQTSIEASKQLSNSSNNVILVRGTSSSNKVQDFPDAVASSGLAYRLKAKVLIVDPVNGNGNIANYLTTNTFNYYVIGGEMAVSNNALKNVGVPVTNTSTTLNVSKASTFGSLDSSMANNALTEEVMINIFEGLYRLKDNGNIVPGIATSFENKNGSTEYIFHLRKDAMWSDGKPVTAHDFVYAWRKVVDPINQYGFGDRLSAIKNAKAIMSSSNSLYGKTEQLGVTAIDNYTLKVLLDYPNPNFVEIVTSPAFLPQPKDFATGKGTNYGTSANSTLYNGPFVISGWKTDSGWQLSKNPRYWDKTSVKLEKINFFIDTDNTKGISNCLEHKFQVIRIELTTVNL